SQAARPVQAGAEDRLRRGAPPFHVRAAGPLRRQQAAELDAALGRDDLAARGGAGMTRPVAVGLLLTRPTKWDTRANLAAALDGLARLAAAGADFAVTCEAFLDGYLAYEDGITPADLRRVAEPADGASIRAVAAAAERLRLHVVFG